MGIPTGVPLKTIPMNREQKQVILAVQKVSHQEKGNRIVTPKRFSLLISLALHLIGVLLATVYIVQTKHIDDDAVQVSWMKVQGAPKPKRRVPPRVVKKIGIPSSPQIQAHASSSQLQQQWKFQQGMRGSRFRQANSLPLHSPLPRIANLAGMDLEEIYSWAGIGHRLLL